MAPFGEDQPLSFPVSLTPITYNRRRRYRNSKLRNVIITRKQIQNN